MANTKSINDGYDKDAGVIGYDENHQRQAGRAAGQINVMGQQFTEAHKRDDAEATRQLNDAANDIRNDLGFEYYQTRLPETLDGTPHEARNPVVDAQVNQEGLVAIAKYGEYAGATAPYQEGMDPELDTKLSELMGKYNEAAAAKDFDSMRAMAGAMNESKMAMGFAPISYAEDIAKLRAPEGASADDLLAYTKSEMESEALRTQVSLGAIKGWKPYEYGTNPELDAQLKVCADQFNMGKDFGQADMMRAANDAANKIRMENGLMPDISFGAIGAAVKDGAWTYTMADAFAKAEDEMESGVDVNKDRDGKKRELPMDAYNKMLEERHLKVDGVTAMSYEDKLREANKLLPTEQAGPEIDLDLGAGN